MKRRIVGAIRMQVNDSRRMKCYVDVVPTSCGECQKMKWIRLALISIFLPLTTFAANCPPQPKTEAALLDLERNWAHALSQHDAATIACFLADEFQDAGVEGELSDRASALAKIPNRRPGQNQLADMHAHIYADTAYVRGLNQVLDASGKQIAQVRFTDIFVYRDHRWEAVAGHETLVPENKQ